MLTVEIYWKYGNLLVRANTFSFMYGCAAKLLLGEALKEGSPLSINPLVLWAWAGLLINAINSIPAGELDGGRISFAIWGRKVYSLRFEGMACLLAFCIRIFLCASLHLETYAYGPKTIAGRSSGLLQWFVCIMALWILYYFVLDIDFSLW